MIDFNKLSDKTPKMNKPLLLKCKTNNRVYYMVGELKRIRDGRFEFEALNTCFKSVKDVVEWCYIEK